MSAFFLLTSYFRKFRWQIALGLLGLVLVDAMQIVVPWLIRSAIDALTTGTATQRGLLKTGLLILLLALGIGATRFVWRYYIIGISRKIEEDLRNRLYLHLQKLSYSYYDRTSVGDLMAHATNDLEAIRMMCGMALVAAMDAVLLLAASLVMMLSINRTLTLYVLLPLPFVTLLLLKLGPKLHKRFMIVQESFSHISEKAQETFAGIRVVKSFVQEQAESEHFRKLNIEYLKANMRLVWVWGLIHPVIWTIAGCCSMLVLLIGGGRVIEGAMSVGDFVAFNSYLGLLIWPMIAVGWVTNLYQRGKASLDRLTTIFNQQPEIVDAPASVAHALSGAIEFRNLTFGYGPSPVLKNITLRIEPGQWVVLMGSTGASKTTLINLIARLYDPPPATVFIDGTDVRNWQLQSLRSQIAYVPQQTFLFSDSIANNISFGLDLTAAAIQDLARSAQLEHEVATFPDGYQTVVGERGVTLSGGQKQRVAIARALARATPLLILDDALSAIDSETEAAIIAMLVQRAKGQTVVIVTHRASVARHADQIVFLHDGEIVERGTHTELLALRGKYFEVYEYQNLLDAIDREAQELSSEHDDWTA